MNLAKSLEWFDPSKLNGRIHIIGCGATGSHLAEMLARYGIENMTIYDFDVVEEKNVANQLYRRCDIGKLKTEALKDYLVEINPMLEKTLKLEGEYTNQKLSGYVFLCVDNIDTRRKICEANKMNINIRFLCDHRIGMLDGQYFAAKWTNPQEVQNLIGSMGFTHEQAHQELSACRQPLSCCTGIRRLCAESVENFISFCKGEEYMTQIFTNTHLIEAFKV